jgi:hypothetical protein
MLKDRLTELMNHYEYPGEYENDEDYDYAYSDAGDVLESVERIMEEEPYDVANFQMEMDLHDAIREYVLQMHDAERGGGRIPDGSDEFIAAVERIIGYEN